MTELEEEYGAEKPELAGSDKKTQLWLIKSYDLCSFMNGSIAGLYVNELTDFHSR